MKIWRSIRESLLGAIATSSSQHVFTIGIISDLHVSTMWIKKIHFWWSQLVLVRRQLLIQQMNRRSVSWICRKEWSVSPAIKQTLSLAHSSQIVVPICHRLFVYYTPSVNTFLLFVWKFTGYIHKQLKTQLTDWRDRLVSSHKGHTIWRGWDHRAATSRPKLHQVDARWRDKRQFARIS